MKKRNTKKGRKQRRNQGETMVQKGTKKYKRGTKRKKSVFSEKIFIHFKKWEYIYKKRKKQSKQ